MVHTPQRVHRRIQLPLLSGTAQRAASRDPDADATLLEGGDCPRQSHGGSPELPSEWLVTPAEQWLRRTSSPSRQPVEYRVPRLIYNIYINIIYCCYMTGSELVDWSHTGAVHGRCELAERTVFYVRIHP